MLFKKEDNINIFKEYFYSRFKKVDDKVLSVDKKNLFQIIVNKNLLNEFIIEPDVLYDITLEDEIICGRIIDVENKTCTADSIITTILVDISTNFISTIRRVPLSDIMSIKESKDMMIKKQKTYTDTLIKSISDLDFNVLLNRENEFVINYADINTCREILTKNSEVSTNTSSRKFNVSGISYNDVPIITFRNIENTLLMDIVLECIVSVSTSNNSDDPIILTVMAPQK